jgi:peptidoglycan/LPS O-acetylase OafA/YrhL
MKAETGHFYYKGLDTLRGIGILWIICCHYFSSINFFRFGWISLEVFFTLSGFLITKVLLHSLKSPHFFKNFYSRRALRIFPIYYLFLVVIILGIFIFSNPNSFLYLKINFPYYFIYIQNFLFVFKGLEPENYLSHLWSLAMEEQFYLLWPLLVYFIRIELKLRKLLVSVIIAVFIFRIWVWWNWGERFEVYHCNTFTRIDTIAFGCLLGSGFSYTQLSKSLRILILLVCISIFPIGIILYDNYFFTNPLFCTFGYSAISLLTIFFLEYFIKEEGKFTFLKTNFLINFLGKISYGMYLFHIPIFFILSSRSGFSNLANGLISICLTFIIAALSYHLYEIRFLRLKKNFST